MANIRMGFHLSGKLSHKTSFRLLEGQGRGRESESLTFVMTTVWEQSNTWFEPTNASTVKAEVGSLFFVSQAEIP